MSEIIAASVTDAVKATNGDEAKKEEPTPPTDEEVDAIYALHGGNPRRLDLGKCLVIQKLPSSFLTDSFAVFEEFLLELLCEEFNMVREAFEKVIRVPRLTPNPESQENALRAIVMFKSRVHKHKIFAQRKLLESNSFGVSALDSISGDMLEGPEDIVVADECGDEEANGANNEHEDEHLEDENPQAADGDRPDQIKDVRPARPVYIDEDENAPFTVNWDGAPEFQWKLCTSVADTHRLIIENLSFADLQNIFIYRTMCKAERYDLSFPMRYNLPGNKAMYGTLTMVFVSNKHIMVEAMSHLIYVRSEPGRRIKIFLPQTPDAMKLKQSFEDKLGRVIEPTKRMHQLVLKVLPDASDDDKEFTIEDAKKWFAKYADDVAEFEVVNDQEGRRCGIVTMSNIKSVMELHSTTPYVQANHLVRCHVLLRGVETHFGSLFTRWEIFNHKKAMLAAKQTREMPPRGPPPAKRARGAMTTAVRPRFFQNQPTSSPVTSSRGRTFNGPPRGAPRGGRGGGGGNYFNDGPSRDNFEVRHPPTQSSRHSGEYNSQNSRYNNVNTPSPYNTTQRHYDNDEPPRRFARY